MLMLVAMADESGSMLESAAAGKTEHATRSFQTGGIVNADVQALPQC
jgi:hypothetical protein